MSNALKFLLLAVGCIIVVGLITLGMRISEKGKKDTDKTLGRYGEAAGGSEDAGLKLYDDADVSGSEIKRLIKRYDGDEYLSIVVDTKKGRATPYINACTDIVAAQLPDPNTAIRYSALHMIKKTDPEYINEAGIFHSSVYYDANDVIACIWFVQH